MDNLIAINHEKIQQMEDDRQLEINQATQHTSIVAGKIGTILPVVVSDDVIKHIDTKIISAKYTNSFNFGKLASVYGNLNMTIGITSANKQEGKTLVASNMAVSLASAYNRSTVLVDLNFKNPQLHKIFKTYISPGVVETMTSKTIHVFQTRYENLYLMTAGNKWEFIPGIQQTLLLRQLLYTLKNKFDTVILDLPSVLPISEFPIHFINEIDGLITVIDAKHTNKDALKRVYKHIDEKRFVGYVFNRVDGKL